jgi:transcriptional regulator with XRE-family HTH domain
VASEQVLELRPDVLVALRKRAGLTQEQLGELVGRTKYAVSKWEAGAAQPPAKLLPLLANAFACSVDYMYRAEAA